MKFNIQLSLETSRNTPKSNSFNQNLMNKLKVTDKDGKPVISQVKKEKDRRIMKIKGRHISVKDYVSLFLYFKHMREKGCF